MFAYSFTESKHHIISPVGFSEHPRTKHQQTPNPQTKSTNSRKTSLPEISVPRSRKKKSPAKVMHGREEHNKIEHTGDGTQQHPRRSDEHTAFHTPNSNILCAAKDAPQPKYG
ncbi:hypothetical protein JTE90_017380 [Oedothorax gibbosus]|uniref:Uncharacterized protein n=1 Tax=Oedothorax gibbosus TaxID=931172 RepID=A0AAV6VQR8_9ARAC|nr:hypothetical protein JTE90_017380 [Oedothorax gibbosus]